MDNELHSWMYVECSVYSAIQLCVDFCLHQISLCDGHHDFHQLTCTIHDTIFYRETHGKSTSYHETTKMTDWLNVHLHGLAVSNVFYNKLVKKRRTYFTPGTLSHVTPSLLRTRTVSLSCKRSHHQNKWFVELW